MLKVIFEELKATKLVRLGDILGDDPESSRGKTTESSLTDITKQTFFDFLSGFQGEKLLFQSPCGKELDFSLGKAAISGAALEELSRQTEMKRDLNAEALSNDYMDFGADASLDAAAEERAKQLKEQKEKLRNDIFAAKMPNSILFERQTPEESGTGGGQLPQSYMDSVLAGLVSDFLVLKLKQREVELEAWQQGKKLQVSSGSKGSKKKLVKQPGSTPLPEFVSRGLAVPYLLRKNAGEFCLPGDEAPSQWALLTIEVHLREAQNLNREAQKPGPHVEPTSTSDPKTDSGTIPGGSQGLAEAEPRSSNVYLSLSVAARLHLSGLISEREMTALSRSSTSSTEKDTSRSEVEHPSQLQTNLLPEGFLGNLQRSFERNLLRWVERQPEKVNGDAEQTSKSSGLNFHSPLSVTAPEARNHATGEIFFQGGTRLYFSKTVDTKEMIGYQGTTPLDETSTAPE